MPESAGESHVLQALLGVGIVVSIPQVLQNQALQNQALVHFRLCFLMRIITSIWQVVGRHRTVVGAESVITTSL